MMNLPAGGRLLCPLARLPLCLFGLVLSEALDGKGKKPILPAYVLNPKTVLVLIDPAAGTPLNAPLANNTAQYDVEKALIEWGRLKPVLEGYTAGLVITMRKGPEKIVQPAIGGLPTLERSPVWRHANKDALRSPSVPAVDEFRKGRRRSGE